LQRFVAIWRLSGSLGLALDAARARTQEVVLRFLESGGRFTPEHVEYRGLELSRSLFAGDAMGGVGYLKDVVDLGGTIEAVHDGNFMATLPNGLRFESSREGLIDSLCMLAERFVADEYSWLDVMGRIVVDVGANIGDSPLYFVKRGARFVYGYEPDPTAYAAAVHNLRLNGISNAEIIKAAVGTGVQSAPNAAVTLNDIIDHIAADNPGVDIVCKIDCEGCEYEIMESENVLNALRLLSQVMIEYHWRSPEPLVAKLRDGGFEVETSTAAPGVGWVRARKAAVS
jgi:hypothetical protein